MDQVARAAHLRRRRLSLLRRAAFAPAATWVETRAQNNEQVGVYGNKDYHVEYYPCPRCGKPMHSESYNPKWYCDPCNYSKFPPSSVIWNGTIDELKAAAS